MKKFFGLTLATSAVIFLIGCGDSGGSAPAPQVDYEPVVFNIEKCSATTDIYSADGQIFQINKNDLRLYKNKKKVPNTTFSDESNRLTVSGVDGEIQVYCALLKRDVCGLILGDIPPQDTAFYSPPYSFSSTTTDVATLKFTSSGKELDVVSCKK